MQRFVKFVVFHNKPQGITEKEDTLFFANPSSVYLALISLYALYNCRFTPEGIETVLNCLP
jgi:hypothetical protein